MNVYPQGSLVQVQASFSAVPTTITLKVQTPLGETTYVSGVGDFINAANAPIYTAQIDTTDWSGICIYEWIGTGACQAPGYKSFVVEPLPL